MKYVIIVLVVVAVWMVTRGRKTGQSSDRPSRERDGSSAMVQCSHCGVYLPRTDALVLGEVYGAGEPPIVAADGRALARALRVAGKVEPVFVENIADLPQAILGVVRDGDVVITMGAGSIGGVPGKLAQV